MSRARRTVAEGGARPAEAGPPTGLLLRDGDRESASRPAHKQTESSPAHWSSPLWRRAEAIGDLDERLMQAARRGDEEAFRALCRRDRPRIERFARRFVGDADLARDLAQETLIRLWQGARTYADGGCFRSFLYTIARNVCRSHARSPAPEGSLDPREDPARVQAPDAGGPTDAVRRAVAGLPGCYREIVVLSVYEGLSYGEIASVLGCPKVTVASRKAAALRLLRDRLATLLEEDLP